MLKQLVIIALLLLFISTIISPLTNLTTGQVQPPRSISLVNTCQAESHAGVASLPCTLSATAGNWIVATGTAAGTNAACTQNPITGINSFSFDAGALFTNWHGANKLSVEVYDSGMLTLTSSLTVTLSGQCIMNFASLIVYQLKGVTAASAPASVNVCNAQPTGVTSLSCTLTSLPGNGWIIGHASADCAACSFTNQINTITQPSDGNFTDYAGTITTVTPNAPSSFNVTNLSSFSGGVSAIEVTGPLFGNANVTSSPGLTGTMMLFPLLIGALGLVISWSISTKEHGTV